MRSGLFILGILAVGLLAIPAHATSAAKPKPAWMEILPTKQTTDAQAAKTAEILLMNEIKQLIDPKSPFFLAARYFNAPGLPKNSFIIAKFEGAPYCGTMGCITYFLKKTDPQKNVWKIAHTSNYNSILTSEALLARQPSFYTKGTGQSPYSRYNAATEKYENRR
ncbi:MAG TPA: hypothetical protein VIN59_01085 [Alphaproteobacteria bacterium]